MVGCPIACYLSSVVPDNLSDILGAGISATAAATFAGLVSFHFIVVAAIRRTTAAPSRRVLRLEASLLAFSAMWMIASLIPYTVFFATRRATVTAFAGRVPVPAATVEETMKSLHASPFYRDKTYCMWFAFAPSCPSEIVTCAR